MLRLVFCDVDGTLLPRGENAISTELCDALRRLTDRGITVAGGGALLRGLSDLLHEQTGLPIMISEDPLSAVAEGTGKYLQENDDVFEEE